MQERELILVSLTSQPPSSGIKLQREFGAKTLLGDSVQVRGGATALGLQVLLTHVPALCFMP